MLPGQPWKRSHMRRRLTAVFWKTGLNFGSVDAGSSREKRPKKIGKQQTSIGLTSISVVLLIFSSVTLRSLTIAPGGKSLFSVSMMEPSSPSWPSCECKANHVSKGSTAELESRTNKPSSLVFYSHLFRSVLQDRGRAVRLTQETAMNTSVFAR